MTGKSMSLRDPAAAHPAPRLLLFPASLRQNSHQRRLIDYCSAAIGASCRIDILAPEQVNLPLFNQDLERTPAVLGHVAALRDRFAAADGLIVSSPEYNGHVSPYLKNTIDWISRLARIDPDNAGPDPFQDKPLLLASASTGWTGGILGLRDARTLFSYLGCLVSADQICVSDAGRWSEDGQFRFEPGFTAYIEQALSNFIRIAGALRNPAAGNTGVQNGYGD